MVLVKRIFYGLVLLPIAEVAAFLAVAALAGFAAAILLLVLVSLAGLWVLRRAVGARPGGASRVFDWGVAAGGILLLLPGFVTGIIGALVLHARSRRWLLRTLASRGEPLPRASGPQVIELSTREWKRLPQPEGRRSNGSGNPER